VPTRRRHLEAADPSVIPDKPYFKIGEAARLCAVKPYVLRYWETEFKSVKPQKTRSQQRLYQPIDIFGCMAGTMEVVGDIISPIDEDEWTGDADNI